ncbi:MAG: hypothetical protein FJZ58_07155 [Chlamydiae bacterium]|nr:hypothetical protein [Chlamydiota bacterium]
MYKSPFFSLCLLAGCVVSCGPRPETSSAVSTQMQSLAPRVAILPLIDNSEQSLSWNISDEFTYTLCSRLDQKGLLQIAPLSRIKAHMKKMRSTYNPFGSDLAWTKQVFAEEDFVVFLELIEHREELNMPSARQANVSPETLSAELNICLRLRILDLRKQEPVITLQEIFQESHFIPRQFTKVNFHQATWNTEEFALSPVGIAHTQLLKQLKSRIEDYILLASKTL